MIINSLELCNFRNYENLKLNLSSGVNIFYGDNAQGKTNILEAIYLSGTTKSHKGSKDRDMIRFGCDEAHIRANTIRGNRVNQIDIHLKKNRTKGIAINKIPINRASELFGILNIVFFSPEDLNIIKNSPAHRRRFLDLELCQLDKIYLSNLTKYNRILRQRNKLLKDIAFNNTLEETLDIWDIQLIECGKQIINARDIFIKEIAPLISKIHYDISGGKEMLDIKYNPDTLIDEFEKKLKANRAIELKNKMTMAGPHRDDIDFNIDGVDIKKYGSQGQQRTTALSLKLSEISLVEKRIKEKPILLLDDVFSELDKNRQNLLISRIKDTQTLITCTGIDEFVKECISTNKTYKVINGKVYESK